MKIFFDDIFGNPLISFYQEPAHLTFHHPYLDDTSKYLLLRQVDIGRKEALLFIFCFDLIRYIVNLFKGKASYISR